MRVKSIAFNQIDQRTGSRIRYQKVSEATGALVDAAHIVKGFDLGGEHYIVIDDADLAPLAPAKSKEIGVISFIPVAQIPAVMYDASYLILPGKVAKPYKLLAATLAGSGKVGVGKFVMRQKEYLAAIRSDGIHLTLSTLVFPDEVVDPATVDELDAVVGVELSPRELVMANTLVEALSDPFDPAAFHDEYRAAVMELIDAKAAGRTLAAPAAPIEHGDVVDLAAALEASVVAAKAARGRHPTSRPVSAKRQAAKPEPKRVRKSA